jgi:peptidoglycan hydrolase-like protein with peptidoglycan-binding domain
MTDSADAAPAADRARPRPRGSALWAIAAVLGAVLVGLIVWLALDRSPEQVVAGDQALATASAQVERRSLSETETVAGTLGYADARPLVAQAPGTLTWLAEEGALLGRGDVVYRVDDTPAVLLFGTVPAYRPLAEGVPPGRDVQALEQNLRALGYDPDGAMDVDREFTSATAAAVERWQADLGLDEDGTVPLGRVVFADGRVRVGAHVLAPGGPVAPGATVLELSSSRQVVTVPLPADRIGLAEEGEAVTVELPSGEDVEGTIVEVAPVAETAPTATGEPGEPTIDVTVALPRGAAPGLVQAPVDVQFTSDSRDDVLAVPVTALLALEGGGYAVEVREDGGTRLVRVEPGLYADGYVEVTGDGLSDGMTVVVPA